MSKFFPKPDDIAPVPRIGLSADDAAKAIGVSKKTLLAIANAGGIPFVEISRQTFIFSPKALAEYIDRNEQLRQENANGQHIN